QADGRPGPEGAFHHSDEPRAAEPAHHRDTPAFQRAGDGVGRALFLEAQFGMRVQIAPYRFQVALERDDRVWKIHVVNSAGRHRGAGRLPYPLSSMNLSMASATTKIRTVCGALVLLGMAGC